MKKSIQKIIAREFLVLIFILLMGLIAFLLTFPYNSYKEVQVNSLEREVSVKSPIFDSIARQVQERNEIIKNSKKGYPLIDWMYSVDPYFKENGITKDQIKSSLFSDRDAYDDALLQYYKEVYAPDYPSLSFDVFLNAYHKKWGDPFVDSLKFDIELLNYQKDSLNKPDEKHLSVVGEELFALRIKKQNIESQILNYSERVNFAKKILLVLAIILFGLRYIIYGVLWSIRTLREK